MLRVRIKFWFVLDSTLTSSGKSRCHWHAPPAESRSSRRAARRVTARVGRIGTSARLVWEFHLNNMNGGPSLPVSQDVRVTVTRTRSWAPHWQRDSEALPVPEPMAPNMKQRPRESVTVTVTHREKFKLSWKHLPVFT